MVGNGWKGGKGRKGGKGGKTMEKLTKAAFARILENPYIIYVGACHCWLETRSRRQSVAKSAFRHREYRCSVARAPNRSTTLRIGSIPYDDQASRRQ